MRQRWVGAAVAVLVLVSGAAWWYYQGRAETQFRRGEAALRDGDWEAAEAAARRLESAGQADRAHLLRGDSLFRQQRYAQAVREFNHITDQGAIRRQAIAIAGQCHLHLGQLGEAARAFHFVLSEDSDHLDAHRGLSAVYWDLGASLRAAVHCAKWAELDPHDGRPVRWLGLIYKERPYDHERAIAFYQEALRRNLTGAVRDEVRQELASCLVTRSEFAEALRVLDGCEPKAARQAAVLALRGEALWGLGRANEAQALVDQALGEHPHSGDLLRLGARLMLNAGDFPAAAARARQALEIDSHDHASRHLLAQACERLGQTADAAEQRRLLKQTQEDLAALTKLNEEASLQPWDVAVRQRLVEVCEKMGKADLAEMWRRAMAASARAAPPR